MSAHGCALFTLVPATQSSKCEISVYLAHNYKIPINSVRGVSQSYHLTFNKVCPNRLRAERRQSGHIPQNPSTWRDKGPKLQSWLSAGLRGNKTGIHKSNSGLSSPSIPKAWVRPRETGEGASLYRRTECCLLLSPTPGTSFQALWYISTVYICTLYTDHVYNPLYL